MSYGLSALVSDIPANLEVGLSKEKYNWDLIAAQTVKVYDGLRLGPLRK